MAVGFAVLMVVFHIDLCEAFPDGAGAFVRSQDSLSRGADGARGLDQLGRVVDNRSHKD